MKKIIIASAAASVLFFTGCFIDSDTATVRINLGNIPVAKVEKKSLIDRFLMIFAKEAVAQEVPTWTGVKVVHLGAFDSSNQLLAKKSLNVTQVEEGPVAINTIVEFDVPARNGVTIVVLGEVSWGEGEGDFIAYYGGNNPPLTLIAGETVNIIVQMVDLNIWSEAYNQLLGIYLDEQNDRFVWNKIIGASRYDVYGWGMEDELVLLQSNLNNYYNGWDASHMLLVFDFAGRKSVEINLAW